MKSYSVTKYIVYIIFLLLFTLSPIPTKAVYAQGVVITVNTLSDELNSNGLCSLREAIINANANDKIQPDCSAGFGEDGIVFIPALEPVTIYLTSALPNISDPAGLTIDGAGDISINGAGTYRAFTVNELASLTLQNMVIANSYHFREGGAIYNAGDLYIFNSSFYENTTPYQGGAIYQPNLIGSSLFIENGKFSFNFSGTRGGAITIEGGKGQILSTSFIQNHTDLSSGDGGAIYIADAALNIHTSVFYNNQARYGAALYSIGGDTDLILRNSTFAYNNAFGSGTIAVNAGNIILYDSTIANNTSLTGLFVIGGWARTFIYNTILANTTSASGPGFDCSSGSIYDFIGNNNLLEVSTPGFPCEIVNGVNGNIVGLDPNLGDMVFTPVYHLPLNSGSPAIDAGNNCEAIDQRGVTRPQGAACDIGSVEMSDGSLPSSPTFVDVPMNHPYWADIEILYANGLTAGCSTFPLLFCPETTMDRAQSAVFMLRGNFGNSYVPPNPPYASPFLDNWSQGTWAQKWAQGMFEEGMTAGCSTFPLLFCPWEQMPRFQAAVFGMRLQEGNSYVPPPATGTVFADITDPNLWYAKWAEAAYANGLLPACGTSAGKPLFCPNDLVSRGLGAYMIVRARDLTMP